MGVLKSGRHGRSQLFQLRRKLPFNASRFDDALFKDFTVAAVARFICQDSDQRCDVAQFPQGLNISTRLPELSRQLLAFRSQFGQRCFTKSVFIDQAVDLCARGHVNDE